MVISIDYNEPNADEYKSVGLSLMSGVKTEFNTGDFVKDWFNCNKHIALLDMEEPIAHSSSVDHFFMDGAPYRSAYLHIYSGDPVLEYEYSEDNLGELFVPEGELWTWEDLKNYCK